MKAEDIPILARIMAVADRFDAMTSERHYRTRLPLEKALQQLRLCSGTQFDPKVVEQFCNVADVLETA